MQQYRLICPTHYCRQTPSKLFWLQMATSHTRSSHTIVVWWIGLGMPPLDSRQTVTSTRRTTSVEWMQALLPVKMRPMLLGITWFTNWVSLPLITFIYVNICQHWSTKQSMCLVEGMKYPSAIPSMVAIVNLAQKMLLQLSFGSCRVSANLCIMVQLRQAVNYIIHNHTDSSYRRDWQ